ncbi:Uncharacterised protein [Serratia quinivorans]|uniref:hypothetical protein n=1 Tax=Serratia quinivorans TaxID=137545 RepID=UPI00217ABAE7|nr:hypothetical protein [Serratia quinivorans]CAI1635457.1 Uncharacterised protein [Serratia quinivorans]
MDPISALALVKQSADATKSIFDAVKTLRSTFKGDKNASGELENITDRLISLRDNLISAQDMIQGLQSKLSLESNEVRSLTEKLREVEKANTEIEKYELHEIIPGKFVHAPKESMNSLAPPHYICTSCASNNFKSILQTETQGDFVWLACHRCGSKIELQAPRGGFWEV